MTPAESPVPGWCAVGATVAVSTRSGFHYTVVSKITATQVVTVNGRDIKARYRRRDLRAMTQDRWYYAELVDPRGEDVRAFVALSERRRVASDVEALMVRLRRDDDLDAAREAVVLLSALLAEGEATS